MKALRLILALMGLFLAIASPSVQADPASTPILLATDVGPPAPNTIGVTLLSAVTSSTPSPAFTCGGLGTLQTTVTITGSATVTFQGSLDGGTTWNAVPAYTVTGTMSTTTTSSGIFMIPVGGMNAFRVNVTTYSTGSITAFARGVALSARPPSSGGPSIGGTVGGSPTNYGVLTVDGSGALGQVSGLGTAGYALTSNGSGALPTWQASSGGGSSQEDARIRATTNQTLLNLTETALTFGTVDFDNSSGSALTAASNQFTIDNTGDYIIDAGCGFGAAVGSLQITVKKNSTIYLGIQKAYNSNGSEGFYFGMTTGVVHLTATDVITLMARQNTGASLATDAGDGSTYFPVFMSIHRVR